MMPQKRTSGSNSHIAGRSRPHSRRRRQDEVRVMAASGLVEDQIALRLRTDKNQLRRKYIDSIKQGRAIARERKAATCELTYAEKCCADVILSSVGSGWLSLLWSGVDGDRAKTPADAYARWLRDGGRFMTAGIRKTFGPERIAEFCALKIEAQALLGDGG
jgi:hypothetical protein